MKQTLVNYATSFLDNLGFDGDRIVFNAAITAHKLGLKGTVDNTEPFNFGEFSMYLDRYDSLLLTKSGKFEETETQAIHSFVKPSTVMLDIGANMGFYSVRVAQKATAGQIISFEPDPGNYATLQKNIQLNKLTNVTTFNAALSDRKDMLRLYKHPFNVGDYRLYNDGDFTEFVDVPTVRIDDVVQTKVDLIKIDVQGYEYFALKGGLALLARDRPVVVSEFWPRGLYKSGSSPMQYLKMMEELGYSVGEIDERNKKVVSMTYEELLKANSKPINRYTNLIFQVNT